MGEQIYSSRTFAESVAHLDEEAYPHDASVLYTNRANAQLRLGKSHAAGAMADSKRAVALDLNYAKAKHWLIQAEFLLDTPETSQEEPPGFGNVQDALSIQAPNLIGKSLNLSTRVLGCL